MKALKCEMCGAPLHGTRCEFCGTTYQPDLFGAFSDKTEISAGLERTSSFTAIVGQALTINQMRELFGLEPVIDPTMEVLK